MSYPGHSNVWEWKMENFRKTSVARSLSILAGRYFGIKRSLQRGGRLGTLQSWRQGAKKWFFDVLVPSKSRTLDVLVIFYFFNVIFLKIYKKWKLQMDRTDHLTEDCASSVTIWISMIFAPCRVRGPPTANRPFWRPYLLSNEPSDLSAYFNVW